MTMRVLSFELFYESYEYEYELASFRSSELTFYSSENNAFWIGR